MNILLVTDKKINYPSPDNILLTTYPPIHFFQQSMFAAHNITNEDAIVCFGLPLISASTNSPNADLLAQTKRQHLRIKIHGVVQRLQADFYCLVRYYISGGRMWSVSGCDMAVSCIRSC